MHRYVVIRTDKTKRTFILRELEAGRLRQGWGWSADVDLRVLQRRLQSGKKLNETEKTVWRNRRLLDTEADGLKPGDVVLVPNLPQQGQWVLARVAGPYTFSLPPPEAEVGLDYGHIVSVEPIRQKNGALAVIDPDNENVDGRLRATMRSPSRMWSIDVLASAVEKLLAAVERGEDLRKKQPATEKLHHFLTAMQNACWKEILAHYHGAQFEILVHGLLESIYSGGRVEHWGGPSEQGADLIVWAVDPLGLEFKIGVQVKLHDGTESDLHSLMQIRQARESHHVDAGVIVTTATDISPEFEKNRAALEIELGIEILVVTRETVTEWVMKYGAKETSEIPQPASPSVPPVAEHGEEAGSVACALRELVSAAIAHGRELDEPRVLELMARLRAQRVLDDADWANIRLWHEEALAFLANPVRRPDKLVSIDDDPRNADWIKIVGAVRRIGYQVPSWAALWLWWLGMDRERAFWESVGAAAKEMRLPVVDPEPAAES